MDILWFHLIIKIIHKVLCILDVVFLSLFDTGIGFQDYKLLESSTLELNCPQTYMGSSFLSVNIDERYIHMQQFPHGATLPVLVVELEVARCQPSVVES